MCRVIIIIIPKLVSSISKHYVQNETLEITTLIYINVIRCRGKWVKLKLNDFKENMKRIKQKILVKSFLK